MINAEISKTAIPNFHFLLVKYSPDILESRAMDPQLTIETAPAVWIQFPVPMLSAQLAEDLQLPLNSNSRVCDVHLAPTGTCTRMHKHIEYKHGGIDINMKF